jgi:hypothetical protein
MRNLLIILLFIFSAIACKTIRLHGNLTPENIEDPPNSTKISNNLYIDMSEISNLDYLEYLSWIKSHYGEESKEYKNILPSTDVWSKLKGNYTSMDTFYLYHPAYREYPVVGVSYEQAQSFSKWRSDRVMEFILVEYEIIPYRPRISKDSIFTIEKYFTGKYNGFQPDRRITTYPEFTLPDSSTYYQATLFAIKINAKNYKSCRKRFCTEDLLIDCNCLDKLQEKSQLQPYGPDPTKPARCPFCRKDIIAHLKGNVREMTSIKGCFYGSCFKDPSTNPNNTCKRDTNYVNCYTGFRNICVYKKWK